MPIFEYQCEECEDVFQELVQNPARPPEGACRRCGSRKIVKVFSSFAAGSGEKSPRGETGRRESPWSVPPGRRGAGGCGTSCGCH